MTGLLAVLLIVLPQAWFYATYTVLVLKATGCRMQTHLSGRARGVSFIIPVRREPIEYLERAVNYIHGLGVEDYEIIVVSDDDEDVGEVLFERLVEWRRKGVNVWLVRRSIPEGYRTGAVNTGLWLSRGDYVYVVDVDAMLDKCLLEKAIGVLEANGNVAAVVGRWEPLNLDTRLSEALGYSMKFIVDAIYRGRSCMGLSVFPLGTGTLFRARVLKGILKGWDQERIQDDMEIGARMMYHGLGVKYIDECAVYVENPSTYRALRIQQSRWAYGATDVLVTRLSHILRSKQGFLGKMEALAFLSQYIVPSLVFLGSLVLAVQVVVRPVDVLWEYAYLLLLLLASQAIFGRHYYRKLKEYSGSGLKALINMGRSAAVTTALSPYYFSSVVKALVRVRMQYARTPKGIHQSASGRLRAPWELVFAAFFTATGLLGLTRGAVVTGLWLLSNALAYSYVIYRWPRDVFFK